jgi:hypothetical protein
MNRDFEIRQLLRAFRSGIMSESAFEEEMTRLEHESGEAGEPGKIASPVFEACGRTYTSEREAVLSFLDELHAIRLDSAIGFAKWSAVCRTKGLKTRLVIAAEREAYHARIAAGDRASGCVCGSAYQRCRNQTGVALIGGGRTVDRHLAARDIRGLDRRAGNVSKGQTGSAMTGAVLKDPEYRCVQGVSETKGAHDEAKATGSVQA